MEFHSTLREANMARAAIWGNGTVDTNWRVNELGGEVGELCNMFKKMVREERGEAIGNISKVNVNSVIDECCDIIICIDLVAMALGWDEVPDIDQYEFQDDLVYADLNRIGIEFQSVMGKVANEYLSDKYNSLHENLINLQYLTKWVMVEKLANDSIDEFFIYDRVAAKFNETSNKAHLRIFMSRTIDVEVE